LGALTPSACFCRWQSASRRELPPVCGFNDPLGHAHGLHMGPHQQLVSGDSVSHCGELRFLSS
jgi:hypothetical protein